MIRKIAFAPCALYLLVWLVILPAVNYTRGTAENIVVKVVSQPFLDSPDLVYRWSGNVTQSCSGTIRRVIVDSANVITQLTPRQFDKIPRIGLGFAEYEVNVIVPLQIAEGPAVYQAIEVPKCSWMQRLFPLAIHYPPVEFTVTHKSLE